MYTIELLLLFIVPCYALNFGIPLPNTLILAGASSLVTWNGLGNVTATNLYLGNGASEDRLTIIKIFGQNIPSSKTSMWVTLPKDTPSDNTYLVLEGNDTPPSRATVPLNVGLGSKTTPSAVPTAGPSSSSSAPPSSSSGSSSSTSPSSSSESTKTNQPSKTRSDTSDATSSTDADTQPSSDDDNDNDTNLSSGQAAGVIVGSIGAAGLVLGAIFFIRRKRRLNNHKRHTELFDEKDNMDATAGGGIYHDYNNNSNHQHYSPPPPMAVAAEPSSYSRSFSHTQPPPSAYYPMKTIESTDMHDNGFQSRTQISPDMASGIPSTTLNKPDEATLADRPDKPHSRS
ncbi:hypothetical protein BCR42DRAFT_414472 [Absidia repens]|uniref:Ser-Thr-rich glycosyl-phosphatidyl-inositol-anchored membrane family-domain-containing protein n=1 Tax=Absidia repens TaxID=90262 RepID=A0A1X2IJ58_9FUNG|nr:hypothetical protein BCR42DRAFT_414472 [Absidia repens]